MKSIRNTLMVFQFFLFLTPAVNLSAQILSNSDSATFDAAHQFLWYKGHWNPNNKKQFIIENDSTGSVDGGTVTVSEDGAVHVSGGSKQEWDKKIEDDIKVIDDWQNKLDNPPSADLATYDLNKLIEPDVKKDKATFESYKIDPKADVLNPGNEQKAGNTLASNVTSYCEKMKPSYDRIMDFWKAHKKDKDADLNVPEPPEFDITCYACDSNLRKIKDTAIERYAKDFFHPEDTLTSLGIELLHGFALIGFGPDGGGVSDEMSPIIALFHQDKKDPSKSGACAYLDLYKLPIAIRDIQDHAYRRAMELYRRHKNDFKAIDAIARVCLEASRNEILFTGNSSADNYILKELPGLLTKCIDYYIGKLKQHDWKELGNIPYIYSLIRQYGLLGGEGETVSNNFMQLQSDIVNNFHLNIDMDIKIGKDGGYELCHLKGEAKITPDFDQENGQCYRWVITKDEPKTMQYWLGGDKHLTINYPIKDESQHILVDLLANQIIAPSPLVPVYAGTKKYYALLKKLKMDFCSPGQDSIILSTFVPSPNAKAGIWNIPHSKPAPLGINGLDHFFQDEEKMQELAESGEAQQGADEMQKKAEELKAKMQALAAQMGNGRTKADLDKYEQLQKMATQMQDLGNNTNVSPMLGMPFQIPVENDIELVNKKFDAKVLNPRQAEVIVYGYYTVKIEYKDPKSN